MITIIHYTNDGCIVRGHKRHQYPYRVLNGRMINDRVAEYAMGDLPPHYPLPAIRRKVDVTDLWIDGAPAKCAHYLGSGIPIYVAST